MPQPDYKTLKKRLERAEAVIKAIQSGEIDAVVLNEQVSLIRPEAELRQTQADLEANRQNFQTLFDSIEEFLFIVTLNGIIRHFNPIVENVLGYGQKELLGAHVFQLKLPDIKVFDSYDEIEIKNDNLEFPEIFLTRQGKVIHVETRMTKGIWSGEVVYFCISRDITERIKYETELNRLNKKLKDLNQDLEQRVKDRTQELNDAKKLAEAANQAKSEFLANMSHELRTPLNGILGYTQILKRDTNLTEKQKNALSVMHKSGEHLLMLINDILDLSKIEAQKMELYPVILSLDDFLDNIVEIVRIRANNKNIEFIYKKSDDLPSAIKADDKRLRQILLNLLGNAVKFTPKGKVIFDISNEKNSICFKITDTGIGITPENQKEIFQAFRQVDSEIARREGTGLGLSISKRLIRLMNSKLYLDSKPGKGSTFWFTVECPEVEWTKPEISDKKLELSTTSGKQFKILIVDDILENRSMLKDMLIPYGFQVFEAIDGADALEKTTEYYPDLILMDMVMPKMNGFEATEQIRKMPLLKDIIIIAVTASVTDDEKDKCYTSGCNDFISKPVQMNDFLKMLVKYLKINVSTEKNTIHEKIPKEKIDSEIIPPPKDILEKLNQLAIKGDILRIKKQAEIMKNDANYSSFGTKIFELSTAFNINEIKKIIGGLLNE